ncbi:MAG: hypothetical protein JW837_16940 [Sedimentisphaerales bacterium]|nr:hypothetical protein [Sedimentisphaerales bacterium]
MIERISLKDDKVDVLSHPSRQNTIHILSLDGILANDVYERIHNDKRMKYYRLIKPSRTKIRETIIEIENMAQDTVLSRLIIIDVRRLTIPKLQKAYNKVVGYNRRDLNKICYTILIGDGPVGLFRNGKTMDIFIPHLATHRVDFHPAVFFYDPFIHYEHGEIELAGVDEEFALPDKIPKRLESYFKKEDMNVEKVRHYFRAIDKPEEVIQKRRRRLKKLYRDGIEEQFPDHKDQLKDLFSRKGIRLASEKMNLYPLYFEDWVYRLAKRAMRKQKTPD